MGVWLWLPVAGPIRTSTVVAGLVLFLFVSLVRRDPIRAPVAVLVWASGFEIVSTLAGVVSHRWPAGNAAWTIAALLGWVILAAVIGVWPDRRISIAFAIVMAAWMLTGYHVNTAGRRDFDVLGEIFNETAKTTLALAYLVGGLHTRRKYLMEELVGGEGRSVICGRLHLGGVKPRLDRTTDGEVPNHSVGKG